MFVTLKRCTIYLREVVTVEKECRVPNESNTNKRNGGRQKERLVVPFHKDLKWDATKRKSWSYFTANFADS